MEVGIRIFKKLNLVLPLLPHQERNKILQSTLDHLHSWSYTEVIKIPCYPFEWRRVMRWIGPLLMASTEKSYTCSPELMYNGMILSYLNLLESLSVPFLHFQKWTVGNGVGPAITGIPRHCWSCPIHWMLLEDTQTSW